MEYVGWIGGFLLAICGVPQAYKSYSEKNSDGVSLGFILFWLVGEIFTMVYTIGKTSFDMIPLILNYVFNILLISIILYYKIKPKR